MTKLIFDSWSDGDTSPSRILNITSDIALTANYKVIENMATVTFNGAVSKQAQPGETVTITVTKPDGTSDVLTCVTDAAGLFTTSEAYPAGDYSAVASVPSDGQYVAKSSAPVPFIVGLENRTITLTVTVG